jgi:hypothetical protein
MDPRKHMKEEWDRLAPERNAADAARRQESIQGASAFYGVPTSGIQGNTSDEIDASARAQAVANAVKSIKRQLKG